MLPRPRRARRMSPAFGMPLLSAQGAATAPVHASHISNRNKSMCTIAAILQFADPAACQTPGIFSSFYLVSQFVYEVDSLAGPRPPPDVHQQRIARRCRTSWEPSLNFKNNSTAPESKQFVSTTLGKTISNAIYQLYRRMQC